jgi:hypothetical protein
MPEGRQHIVMDGEMIEILIAAWEERWPAALLQGRFRL